VRGRQDAIITGEPIMIKEFETLKYFRYIDDGKGEWIREAAVYKIGKYGIWAEKQMIDKYGDKLTEKLLAPQNEIILSEIIYLLGDDALKKEFPTLDDFQKSAVTIDDKFTIVTTAWSLITPAITTKKTDKEVEEENFNKKKAPKKWSFGSFVKSLFTNLTKPSVGKTGTSAP
jgi:hypothetical protein